MSAKFYKIRLAKGAPYSALKIWRGFPINPDDGSLMMDRPILWRAFLNGEDVPVEDHAIEFDQITTEPVIKGELISEDDYLLLMKTNLWAKEHKPDAPEANPRKAIDLNSLPPIQW